jgi:hypothetical protein
VKEWRSARDVSWRNEEAGIAERTSLKHSSQGGRPSFSHSPCRRNTEVVAI